MTKKCFLMSLCLTAVLSFTSVNVYADPEGVVLQVGYDEPDWGDDGLQKTPILIPEVSLDDHTLIFDTPCDGCTLRLVDANNNVVYSTVIPTGTTSLVLPSSLSGEYKILIIQDNLYFYGYINL